MKLHSVVLFVKDIASSKQFYLNVLKCSIEHDFGKSVILDNGISLWEIQPSHPIASELDTMCRTNRFELYFEENDVEQLEQQLANSNAKFLHKMHEEHWGQRTIRFFDPDGHLIEIGEPLEVFVCRMAELGLTHEQISEKTGIALGTVGTFLKNNSN